MKIEVGAKGARTDVTTTRAPESSFGLPRGERPHVLCVCRVQPPIPVRVSRFRATPSALVTEEAW